MAFIARNINMLSVELKGTIVMIEFRRLPVIGSVAFCAFRFATFCKLVEMIVRVTGCTG